MPDFTAPYSAWSTDDLNAHADYLVYRHGRMIADDRIDDANAYRDEFRALCRAENGQ